jgi:hypothetical protein
MLYNILFNDSTYNDDKERAIRIINKFYFKIDELKDNKEVDNTELNDKDRKLILKILKYQFNIV